MVFQDMGQIREIDNELILFKELFKFNNCKYRNSLLISHGGRITQHLIEFIAGRRGIFDYGTYDSAFKDFLDECDFIPHEIEEVILRFNSYRKNVVYSLENEKELNGIMSSYFKTFNDILKWFYGYCNEHYNDANFEQINNTIEFLEKEEYVEYEDRYSILVNKLDEIIQMDKEEKEQLNEMSQKQDEHIKISKDTNYNVKQLRMELEKFYNDYLKEQEKISEKLGNNPPYEKLEKEMKKFSDKTVTNIKKCIKRTLGDYKFEEEKDCLIKSLGYKTWDKLDERSQSFLTTAVITFDNLGDLGNNIDYSGVCLLVTKALELELCTRFRKMFLDYLKDKDYSEYPPSLLNINRNTGNRYPIKRNQCSLGTIVHLFGFIPDSEINNISQKKLEEYEKNLSITTDYSKEMLFKNFSDDEEIIRKTLLEYGSYVDKIRVDYRNPAAHTRQLDQTSAEECFKYVLRAKKVLKIMVDSFDE